jgi:DNA-binding NarL/FixJ family response regulator
VRGAAQLAAHQRQALALGQATDLGDDAVELLPRESPVRRVAALRRGDERQALLVVVQIGQTLLAVRVRAPKDSRPTVAAGGRGAVPQVTAAQRRVLEALCRPYKESQCATPAMNQQVAEELLLSVDAVKAHLRALFAAFGVEDCRRTRSGRSWRCGRCSSASCASAGRAGARRRPG